MITAGVDLSSKPKSTYACVLEWASDHVRAQFEARLQDDRILELAVGSDKVGVDAPFGWPEDFVTSVEAHHKRQDVSWPPETVELRLRRTDRWVSEVLGRAPLSVSSDRIAMPAIRFARIQARWERQTGRAVDRAGGGEFVEVYPAVALKVWGFDARGYKTRDGVEKCRELAAGLLSRLPWLTLDERQRDLIVAEHDALDALVCALVARAAAIARTARLPDTDRDVAQREGWIHTPSDPDPGSLLEPVGGRST